MGSQAETASGKRRRLVCVCDKSVPPASDSIIGSCPYYPWRKDNFQDRHNDCGHIHPKYYLNYGHYYCVKFSKELQPKLSAKGKDWLDKARKLLQVYMEEGLADNPSVELDNDEFQKFAFKTHPDAYWDAGLNDVPFEDKVKIALTPDAKEWLDGRTWEQAADVGWRAIKEDSSKFKKKMEEKANEVSQSIRRYFRNLFK